MAAGACATTPRAGEWCPRPGGRICEFETHESKLGFQEHRAGDQEESKLSPATLSRGKKFVGGWSGILISARPTPSRDACLTEGTAASVGSVAFDEDCARTEREHATVSCGCEHLHAAPSQPGVQRRRPRALALWPPILRSRAKNRREHCPSSANATARTAATLTRKQHCRRNDGSEGVEEKAWQHILQLRARGGGSGQPAAQ